MSSPTVTMLSSLSTLSIILPIFALIFAGYLSRRLNLLGPGAATELNRFVIYLALPALLFDIMARVHWAQLEQPGFIAAFGLAAAALYALTVLARVYSGRALADASIDGIAAAYANTAYIGFPLCLIVFGRDSLAAVTIATIVTVCVLFAVAIVIIEFGLQRGAGWRALGKVGRSLLRNPLLMSPILGALWNACGLPLPGSAETFFKLLGNAASPCALVGLGLFLAQQRASSERRDLAPAALVGVKLLLQPALTWFLAYRVFSIPTAMAQVAVLLAALPTGTGPFMLAEFYRREAGATSRTILLSTLGSLVTLALLLSWLRPLHAG
jgi:malonate transporter and related proteins